MTAAPVPCHDDRIDRVRASSLTCGDSAPLVARDESSARWTRTVSSSRASARWPRRSSLGPTPHSRRSSRPGSLRRNLSTRPRRRSASSQFTVAATRRWVTERRPSTFRHAGAPTPRWPARSTESGSTKPDSKNGRTQERGVATKVNLITGNTRYLSPNAANTSPLPPSPSSTTCRSNKQQRQSTTSQPEPLSLPVPS